MGRMVRNTYAVWSVLFLVFYFSYRPGLFDWDSYELLRQAHMLDSNNWQPTITPIVWSILLPLFGTSSIFLFNCLLYFASFAWLSHWHLVTLRAGSFSVLVLAIAPTSLMFLMWNWKDSTQVALGIFVIAAYFWAKAGSHSRWLLAALLFAIYFSVNVRHGMSLVLFPLVALFIIDRLPGRLRAGFFKRVAMSLLISLFILISFVAFQRLVNRGLGFGNMTPSYTFYYDIVGTLAHVKTDSNAIDKFPDEYLKDPCTEKKERLLATYLQDPNNGDLLATPLVWEHAVKSTDGSMIWSWATIILSNPAAYWEHRRPIVWTVLSSTTDYGQSSQRSEIQPYWEENLVDALERHYGGIGAKNSRRIAEDIYESTFNYGNLTTRIISAYSSLSTMLTTPLVHLVFAVLVASVFISVREFNLPLALSASVILQITWLAFTISAPGLTRYFSWCYLANGVTTWVIYIRIRYGLRI